MTAVKELKAVTCPALKVHTDPSSRFLQLYICYLCILENVRGPEGSDLKRNLIQRMSEMTFDPGRCAKPGYLAPSFGLWRVLRSEDVMYASVQ